MANKKFQLVLVMVLFTAVCWVMAVIGHAPDDKEKQAEALEGTDQLIADGLYVRALEKYEEALAYDTDQNDAIEKKMLSAYLALNDMGSYKQLVEERTERGEATEEEYVNLVRYYLSMGQTQRALEAADEGRKLFDECAELTALWEENRFGYRLIKMEYAKILQAGDNELFPVYNGEKWGYVSSMGSVEIPMKFDWASAFEGGYALVQTDGRYYVTNLAGNLYSIQDEAMTEAIGVYNGKRVLGKVGETWSYFNIEGEAIAKNFQFESMSMNHEELAAVCKDGAWALMRDNGEYVTDFIWDSVRLDEKNIAVNGGYLVAEKDGSCVLVQADGSQVSGFSYPDAKAPGSDELIAVCDENEKWGFADHTGKLVIPCTYQDAKSFSGGLAPVYDGINWGYINAAGEMVIEPSFEEAGCFFNGYAIVEQNGGMAVVALKYVEENE